MMREARSAEYRRAVIEALLGERIMDWFRHRGSDPIDFALALAMAAVAVTMAGVGVAYMVSLAGRTLGYG